MKTKASKPALAASAPQMVTYEINPSKMPSLTAQQKTELAALRDRPESEINFSDIPPLTDDFWQNAIRNPFYKPTKHITTVRMDSDVLMWLKAKGRGYQTRINTILRLEMQKEISKA